MSTSTTTPCKARQVSDQMNCHRCGYVWDMNDPDPPTCKTPTEIASDLSLEFDETCRNASSVPQDAMENIRERLKS